MSTGKRRTPRGTAGGRLTGSLPPVSVHCNGCGGDYLSTAEQGTPTRCSHCRHANRVKRAAPVHTKARAPQSAKVFQPPQRGAARTLAAEAPPAAGDLGDEDDGTTWMRDEHGRLVLAEWTPGHGLRVVQPSPSQQARDLEKRGYRENRSAPPGGCHIHESRPAGQDCALAASCTWGSLRICGLPSSSTYFCIRHENRSAWPSRPVKAYAQPFLQAINPPYAHRTQCGCRILRGNFFALFVQVTGMLSLLLLMTFRLWE